MKETAKQIMDRLRKEYADYPEALELINNSYDAYISYPPEKGRRLALDAEATLSLYF